jgi:protein TonB
MSISKNPRVDLKRKQPRILETGMILSLAFLILAFNYFPEVGGIESLNEPNQGVTITIDDGIITHHPPDIPPPPEPRIIVAKMEDEEIPDIEFVDTGLDVNKKVTTRPPEILDDANDETEDEPPFEFVEKMPTPVGGIESIQKRINYPDYAVRIGLQGRVTVRAYVDKDGNVYKVEIQKGIGGGCDEAAAEAVLNSKFHPGEQRGKPVKVMVSIPISFKLR